ncbi:ABC transporter ATP-binding protein [Cumulibacter soli]|uniref:ABC transporter ATP-binding protein n=1 Tax=Cumulibacter soli TaxID=2546344 RepID=UPI001068185F|nr:ATP-binding cassette domain-containing protein [Cumulibacter soli]
MSDVLLRAESLTAGYAGAPAVRDVNLEVRPGEVVAVLGPNGAGKTTTLLSLVGLLPLMSGSVTALGHPVLPNKSHLLARRGGLLVPDDRGLFPSLSVQAHLRLARSTPDLAREQEVLDRFPALADLRGRPAGLLSGGEQQMLTIAKALVAAPKLLLIDEMSLGLAPKIIQELLPLIRDLAKEEGIGVVLVEQHIDLVLQVADKGLILNHSHVVLEGPATDLRARRADVEAAYFGAGKYDVSDSEAAATTELGAADA